MDFELVFGTLRFLKGVTKMITFDSNSRKTTYSDGDSLSGDLGEKVRRGDKDALQKLKEFAETEDPEQPHSQARALYELAKVHFSGFCEVKKSATEALKFLIQAVELNDDLASLRLGEFYRDGKQGFKQDGQKALELFLKAAEHGNKNGFRLAAEMFRAGQGGFKADGYKAIEFYEKLDALDDKQALISIAEICEEGCGKFKADGKRALEIYDEIIRHGKYWDKIHHDFGIESYRLKNYKEALSNAAQIYLEGKAGVVPDGYKAIECFSKLAEEDTEALKEIAEIYLEGKAGVEPNPQKAIEYFLKHEATSSSDNFNRVRAFGNIAEIYSQLNDGQKALEYFLKADECGDEYGDDGEYLWLAKIYREGRGNLKPDGVKLIEYLTKKLEQDESCADIILYDIAEAYEEGCGSLEPNIQKALEFYRKAAALGNNFAETKLAKLTGSCK